MSEVINIDNCIGNFFATQHYSTFEGKFYTFDNNVDEIICFHEKFFNNKIVKLLFKENDSGFFKEVSSEENALRVKFNGEDRNIVKMFYINPHFAFELHNLSFEEEFFNLMNSRSSFFSNTEKSIRQISEMRDWQSELNDNSLGYKNIHEQDIEQISYQLIENFDDFIKESAEEMKKAFFDYSDSSVRDLSVSHGVRFFEWDQEQFEDFFSSASMFKRSCKGAIRSLIFKQFSENSKLKEIALNVFIEFHNKVKYSDFH